MAAPKDYYKILGVDEKADAKAIKSQYRRLARKYHPDIGGKASEDKFKEINEAYEVLSEPEKRAEYDRLRYNFAHRQARSRGPGFQRVGYDWNEADLGDWGNIFEDLFGGRGAGAETATRRTHVPEETVAVTLEQVALGATVSMTVSQRIPCPVCYGRDPNCPRCGGLGQVEMPKKYDVKIPPGVEDGTILRVGDYARLKVEIQPHPRFVPHHKDLRGQVMVSVPVAAVGGEVRITPLVGEPVVVKIPPHTNHGKVLRLKGLGLPGRGGKGRGDLFLEVALRFPEPFTEEDDQAYQRIKQIHSEEGGDIHAPR